MRPPPPITDEDAFLAAIADAPLDDAPRLVYADWLQDRGQEAKADYVRAVVTVMHPPEDPAAVAKCVALADGLDPEWRQAVGGRFEVWLEGQTSLLWFASVFQMVAELARRQPMSPREHGKAVRLRTALTREDAEAFVRRLHEPPLYAADDEGEPPLRLVVRPMTDSAERGMFDD